MEGTANTGSGAAPVTHSNRSINCFRGTLWVPVDRPDVSFIVGDGSSAMLKGDRKDETPGLATVVVDYHLDYQTSHL